MAKKQEAVQSPATPQITFTEDDVKKLQDFGQLLVSKATLNLSIQEAIRLSSYVQHMNYLTKKIEAHIFEVKRVTTEAVNANNADK